jgi:hypothetical protein
MNDFSLMPSAVYIYLAATVIFDPVLLVGPVMLLLSLWFDLVWVEQTIFITLDQHTNHYATEVVDKLHRK